MGGPEVHKVQNSAVFVAVLGGTTGRLFATRALSLCLFIFLSFMQSAQQYVFSAYV